MQERRKQDPSPGELIRGTLVDAGWSLPPAAPNDLASDPRPEGDAAPPIPRSPRVPQELVKPPSRGDSIRPATSAREPLRVEPSLVPPTAVSPTSPLGAAPVVPAEPLDFSPHAPIDALLGAGHETAAPSESAAIDGALDFSPDAPIDAFLGAPAHAPNTAAGPSLPPPAKGPGAPSDLVGIGKLRLRLGSIELPLAVLGVAVVVVTAALAGFGGFGVGFAIGRISAPAAPLDSAGAPVEKPAASSAPVSVIERARSGEPEAVTQLETIPHDQRSPEEALALAEGRTLALQRGFSALRSKLEAHEGKGIPVELQAELIEFARHELTALEALRSIAALPGALGPDLLYEVWTGTSERTRSTELAEALVYGKEVRGRASPALSVALDLRRASDCESYKALLPRAIEHGDRRSLHLLGRLSRRHGCGPRKNGDCYPCLREGDVLKRALQAVRGRAEPKFR